MPLMNVQQFDQFMSEVNKERQEVYITPHDPAVVKAVYERRLEEAEQKRRDQREMLLGETNRLRGYIALKNEALESQQKVISTLKSELARIKAYATRRDSKITKLIAEVNSLKAHNEVMTRGCESLVDEITALRETRDKLCKQSSKFER